MGYHLAGFEVVGVDIKPQPRYPFEFHQGDALEYLRQHGHEFDAIHASPPCQRWTQAQRLHGKEHPDLLTPTRAALVEIGKPYIIENVPGAPLVDPVQVCGLSLGLRVKRHRLFESSETLYGTECIPGHPGDWVTVFGGGAPAKPDNRRRAAAAVGKAAMGVEWMARDGMSQAIPPAYTEFLGLQLRAALMLARAA